jgi:chromosome segregation ATPase
MRSAETVPAEVIEEENRAIADANEKLRLQLEQLKATFKHAGILKECAELHRKNTTVQLKCKVLAEENARLRAQNTQTQSAMELISSQLGGVVDSQGRVDSEVQEHSEA